MIYNLRFYYISMVMQTLESAILLPDVFLIEYVLD